MGKARHYVGAKDQEMKNYLRDPVLFADLMNGTVFQGKQIIEPEYLKPTQRKKSVYLGNSREDGDRTHKKNHPEQKEPQAQYLERERDAIMLHDKADARFYIACESQSAPDYTMPVRDCTYDSVEYTDQITGKERETVQADRRSRPLVPVFHQTLYLGEKRWLSRHSLQEMMEIPGAVEEFRHLLPDYHIYLADIHEQNPEHFRTEWKDIFALMGHSRKKEELKNYMELHMEELKKLTPKTQRLILSLLDQDLTRFEERKEAPAMCEAWDGAMQMYKDEGRIEGMREGKIEGIREGRTEGKIEGIILSDLYDGKDKPTILQKLQTLFSMTNTEAEENYLKYTAKT